MSRRKFMTPEEQRKALLEAARSVERLGIAPLTRLRYSMPRSYMGPAYGEWLKRQREVAAEVAGRLRDLGASVSETANETRFSFKGIKSSSTMGLQGALGNWRRRAREKLGAGQ